VAPAVLSQRNKKKVGDTSDDIHVPGPGSVQCGQAITENVCALQCDSCKGRGLIMHRPIGISAANIMHRRR